MPYLSWYRVEKEIQRLRHMELISYVKLEDWPIRGMFYGVAQSMTKKFSVGSSLWVKADHRKSSYRARFFKWSCTGRKQHWPWRSGGARVGIEYMKAAVYLSPFLEFLSLVGICLDTSKISGLECCDWFLIWKAREHCLKAISEKAGCWRDKRVKLSISFKCSYSTPGFSYTPSLRIPAQQHAVFYYNFLAWNSCFFYSLSDWFHLEGVSILCIVCVYMCVCI